VYTTHLVWWLGVRDFRLDASSLCNFSTWFCCWSYNAIPKCVAHAKISRQAIWWIHKIRKQSYFYSFQQ